MYNADIMYSAGEAELVQTGAVLEEHMVSGALLIFKGLFTETFHSTIGGTIRHTDVSGCHVDYPCFMALDHRDRQENKASWS